MQYINARMGIIFILFLFAGCKQSLLPPEPAMHQEHSLSAEKSGRDDLAPLRRATARYQRVEVAEADGYTLVSGLDHCFTNQPAGDMGFHYIDTANLDLSLDPLRPEAMVYAPGPDGRLTLGAVEFIVPAAAWDDAGNTEPPVVLDRHLHLNEKLGVYVLHAWIFRNNPAGMFEDWNPAVSCPE